MSQKKPSSQQYFSSCSLENTKSIAQEIVAQLEYPACVYLHGDLGVGKTTICQSIIASLGCQEAVTSPTYNLIQEYSTDMCMVYHMDLYRLQEPEELEYLALADLWNETSLFLIEWPENGQPYVPKETHSIELVRKDAASAEGRDICFSVS